MLGADVLETEAVIEDAGCIVRLGRPGIVVGQCVGIVKMMSCNLQAKLLLKFLDILYASKTHVLLSGGVDTGLAQFAPDGMLEIVLTADPDVARVGADAWSHLGVCSLGLIFHLQLLVVQGLPWMLSFQFDVFLVRAVVLGICFLMLAGSWLLWCAQIRCRGVRCLGAIRPDSVCDVRLAVGLCI